MYHVTINIMFITLFSNRIHCNVLKRNIITMSNTYIINSVETHSSYRNVTRSLCSIKLDRKPFSFQKQGGDACYTVKENGGDPEKYILGDNNDWNTYHHCASSLIYWRRVWIWRKSYVLRTSERKRTPGQIHMGPKYVVLSKSRPNATYYWLHLPSGIIDYIYSTYNRYILSMLLNSNA